MKIRIPSDIERIIYQYLYADVRKELLKTVVKDETCYTTRDKINTIIDFCLNYEKNFKPGDNSGVLIIYEEAANSVSRNANYFQILCFVEKYFRTNAKLIVDLFGGCEYTKMAALPTIVNSPKIDLYHTHLILPWMDQYPRICLSNMVSLTDNKPNWFDQKKYINA